MKWPWNPRSQPEPLQPEPLPQGEALRRLIRPGLYAILAGREITPPDGWVESVLSTEGIDGLSHAELIDYIEDRIDLLDPVRYAQKLAEARRTVERIRSRYRRAVARYGAPS